jgi:hypothetical protein
MCHTKLLVSSRFASRRNVTFFQQGRAIAAIQMTPAAAVVSVIALLAPCCPLMPFIPRHSTLC